MLFWTAAIQETNVANGTPRTVSVRRASGVRDHRPLTTATSDYWTSRLMAATLESIVADALRIPASSVSDALEFNGIPQWDSLNHVALMLAIEAEYGVSIPDDLMVELTSVAAIRDFVDGRAKADTNL